MPIAYLFTTLPYVLSLAHSLKELAKIASNGLRKIQA